jgi:hypothetical protein
LPERVVDQGAHDGAVHATVAGFHVEEGLHPVGAVHPGGRSRDAEPADAEVGDEFAAPLFGESCIATDRERALDTSAADRVEPDDDPDLPTRLGPVPPRSGWIRWTKINSHQVGSAVRTRLGWALNTNSER